MDYSKKKKPQFNINIDPKYYKYLIGAGILLVLIIVGIIIGVNSCGRQDQTQTEIESAAQETETEAPALSEEELEESKAQAEKEAHDKAIEDEIASYGNLGICRLEDGGYLNVRAEADVQSDIVGKLYDGSACSITEEGDEWSKIKSGEITGYVKTQYLMTGDEAQQFAHKIGKED